MSVSDPHTEIREALENAYDALRSGDTPRFKHLDEALAALAGLEREAAERETALAELQTWGQQVHDALDGRALPPHPNSAPARIVELLARVREVEAERDGAEKAARAESEAFLAERDKLKDALLERARAEATSGASCRDEADFDTAAYYTARAEAFREAAVLASPEAAAAEPPQPYAEYLRTRMLVAVSFLTPEQYDHFRGHVADLDARHAAAALPAVDAPPPACERCGHRAHAPGRCPENVGTGFLGPVLCRCGAFDAPPRQFTPTDVDDLCGLCGKPISAHAWSDAGDPDGPMPICLMPAPVDAPPEPTT